MLGAHVAIGWRPNTKIDLSLFWPGRSHIFTLTLVVAYQTSKAMVFVFILFVNTLQPMSRMKLNH